jgi:hypothetical protein
VVALGSNDTAKPEKTIRHSNSMSIEIITRI